MTNTKVRIISGYQEYVEDETNRFMRGRWVKDIKVQTTARENSIITIYTTMIIYEEAEK